MPAPEVFGRVRGVVPGEIVGGDLYREPLVPVAEIFACQRVVVILGVPGYIELAHFFRGDYVHPRLLRRREHLQVGHQVYVLFPDLGVPRMGHLEYLVEPPHELVVGPVHRMGEHPEQLLFQGVLVYPVMEIQPRLRPPAYVQGGIDVFLRPFHDLAELVPVIDPLEGQCLHRGPGYYEPVEFFAFHLGERLVERAQVLGGGVLGLMGGGADQNQLDLERGVGQQPYELGFGYYLRGHYIEYGDSQGAYVLVRRFELGHHENVLF